MKKLLFVFMIAVLLVQGVWSFGEREQVSPNDIEYVKDISVDYSFNQGEFAYNKRVYFFSGFKFGDYNITHPGIAGINAIERGIINAGSPNGENYAIIGHSQGGLRALGYISQLPSGQSNDIDAVITTAGIDQGLKAIEYGVGTLKSRTKEKINIVANGIMSVAGIFFVTDLYTAIGIRNVAVPSITQTATNLLLSLFSEEWRNYGLVSWDGNVPQQINDMVPGSAYITKNVVQTKQHPNKAISGYRQVAEWRWRTLFWGISVPYLWYSSQPVYSYYLETEVIPKFDPNVPIGFIVGTNNDALEMLDEPRSDTNENIARGVLAGCGGFFTIAGIGHIANCATMWGLFTGSTVYAVDATRAAYFCFNIDSEIMDLICSREGDGLVAKSHQYIPRTSWNPNTRRTEVKLNSVLGNQDYYPIYDNHRDMGPENTTVMDVARRWIHDGADRRGNR